MKRIEILPGIQTSVLGFGCAPILGSVDGKTALKALSVALDSGITHFDLARSYGYGQAEGFVGKFLKGKRDQVTITTKFGIQATEMASLLAPLKPLLRSLKKPNSQPSSPDRVTTPTASVSKSGLKSKLADLFHRRLPLTAAVMQKSLETSLKEIGTDHIDFFFVHEPTVTIAAIDDLLSAADKLKRDGKIRAFGLAMMMRDQSKHAGYIDRLDIMQFDNSPGAAHYAETLDTRAHSPNIFFSPFRHRSADEAPKDIISRLTADFPKSITLCSMFKPEHIRQNAAAA